MIQASSLVVENAHIVPTIESTQMIPKENIEQIQVIQDPETERSNVISQHAAIEEFPVIQNRRLKQARIWLNLQILRKPN